MIILNCHIDQYLTQDTSIPLVYELEKLHCITTVNDNEVIQPLQHFSDVTSLPTSSPSTSSSLQTPPTKRVKLSSELSCYADYLRAVYSTSPIAKSDKFPPTISNVFVKLALVKKEKVTKAKADEFIRLTLQGDVDQIMQVKEPIVMDDILKADDEARLVVVEGAPGIGKSTLAWELCRQWLTLESLKRFSLVVLLRLREETVQSAKDINGFFPCGDDPDLSSRVVQKVKGEHGNGVLFVLDGFDEFPLHLRKSLDSTVMNVIAGKLLPKATILLTSRPSATTALQSDFQKSISKHIEIVGFSGAEIQEYAESIFGKTPKTLDSFNAYLSANPVVKGMMYNPLNCAIVVGVYQDTYQSGRSIPHTQTQLYTELTLCLLSRYLSAKGDPLAKKLPDKLEGLPHDSDLYQQLVKVGELAFNGKLKEEVIFKELPEGCSDLGLLVNHTALYTRSETTTYNFFHLTMQEYMSAFYISQLPADQQKFYFSRQSMRWDVTWRFVAGLTKMQKIGWDTFTYGENAFEEYRVSSLLVECLYEAQDVQSCENIFSQSTAAVTPIKSWMLTRYSNYELYALGYCISVCSNITNVKIQHITQDGLEMLGHGMRSVEYHGGGSLELNLSSRLFEGVINEGQHLLHIPCQILKHIKTLTLMNCSIDQRGFENLAECVPYLHSLISLNISKNRGGEGSLVKLFQALKKHEKLQELYMHSINIGMTDVAALADLIQPSSSMKVLSVNSISFELYELLKSSDADATKQLVMTVLSPSSLNTVFMLDSRNPLDFIESISDNISNLYFHYLDQYSFLYPLTDNPNRIKGGTKFSRIIRENTSLKKLVLYIPLEKDEVHDIIDSLKDNCSLEMLVLVEGYHLQYFSEQQALDPRVIFSP